MLLPTSAEGVWRGGGGIFPENVGEILSQTFAEDEERDSDRDIDRDSESKSAEHCTYNRLPAIV